MLCLSDIIFFPHSLQPYSLPPQENQNSFPLCRGNRRNDSECDHMKEIKGFTMSSADRF